MNNISNTLRKLVVSHSFFLLGRVGMRIFLGLYIWSISQSVHLVALYEILFLISHGLTFYIIGRLIKKGHVYLFRTVGLLGTLLIMLSMAVLGEHTIAYIVPLALIYGVFNAMYWISHHTLTFVLTHTKNRGNYTAHELAGKILAALVMPVIAGYLITANLFGIGYANVFVFGALMICVSLIFGKFHVVKKEPETAFNIQETIRHVRKNTDLQKVLLAGGLANFSTAGALSTLLPIFLITVVGTEFAVGGWISFFGILSIITSILIGKYLHYNKYKTASLIAGVSVATALSFLIALPSLLSYAVYGSLKEIMSSPSSISRRTYYQNLLHQLPDHRRHRTEYIVIREWYTSVFRIIGYTPLLFVTSFSSSVLTILLSGMALALCIEPFLIKSIQADLTTIT